MISSHKVEIAEYEGFIDRYGLARAWTHVLLPTLANVLRPDLSISDMPLPLATASNELMSLSSWSERTGELYEYGLAYADKDAKKKLGQYYTPRDVATFMATKLFALLEEDGKTLGDCALVEPCCGCGGLLFPLLDQLDAPWTIISKHLRLYDADETAIAIAKTMLVICYAPQNAEVSLSSIWSQTGDFLADDVVLNSDDAVISNPPYGRVDGKLYPGFESASANDLYALFMEKCLDAGYVSIITPQSFIGASKFRSFRKALMEKASGIVYAYDNVPSPVFCGRKHGVFSTNTVNSVRAAITFFTTQKGAWKVLPFMRFRAEERPKLFEYSEQIATQALVQTDDKIWLKMPLCVKDAFLGDSKITLGEIVSDEETEYALHVPSTPRYYTSAAVRELNRSSMATLHFKTREDMAVAYVLLNSSIPYAWWRICDGGISLGNSVLMSTPFEYPDSSNIDAFIERFEEQSPLEAERLHVKMNAGKPNESIKIGSDEIAANTRLIVPGLTDGEYAALAGFHCNSIADLARAWSFES